MSFMVKKFQKKSKHEQVQYHWSKITDSTIKNKMKLLALQI